jgi:hypothetical protein
MGMNSGEVAVGTIGEDLGMEFTAVGHTVGLAERFVEICHAMEISASAKRRRAAGGAHALASGAAKRGGRTGPRLQVSMRTCVRDIAGGAYSQFKRALERRNFMLAWTMAAELPKVPLADGLELLLLARDLEPARFDRAVPRLGREVEVLQTWVNRR